MGRRQGRDSSERKEWLWYLNKVPGSICWNPLDEIRATPRASPQVSNFSPRMCADSKGLSPICPPLQLCSPILSPNCPTHAYDGWGWREEREKGKKESGPTWAGADVADMSGQPHFSRTYGAGLGKSGHMGQIWGSPLGKRFVSGQNADCPPRHMGEVWGVPFEMLLGATPRGSAPGWTVDWNSIKDWRICT